MIQFNDSNHLMNEKLINIYSLGTTTTVSSMLGIMIT